MARELLEAVRKIVIETSVLSNPMAYVKANKKLYDLLEGLEADASRVRSTET